MYNFVRASSVRWIWRGLAVLALAAGLMISQAARAETGYASITLYAPGAPAEAWVGVQWQDGTGAWQNVEGWQGGIDVPDDSGTPFKQWTVFPENYGQDPFRWVIYTEPGGAVWGVSPGFDLPSGDGEGLAMTVEPPAVATTTDTTVTPTAPAVNPIFAIDPFTEAPRVAADSSTWFFECEDDCDHGLITAFLPDAPVGSRVGVQWQEPNGTWHNVEGWQSTLLADDSGTPFVTWTVFPENYDQGPFRWVVTQPDGSAWGISPDFNLPTKGVNYILFLLRH